MTSTIHSKGFTLAEVLIALALLGIVAAFTIPNVLQSTNDERYNTIAKEFIGDFSEALELYKQNNTISANTRVSDIMALLNTLGRDTTSSMDFAPNWPGATGPYNCATSALTGGECYKLANGAVVGTTAGARLGTLTGKEVFVFGIDPDGKPSNIKQVAFCVRPTGKIYTAGNCPPNSTWETDLSGGSQVVPMGTVSPQSSLDPTWFHW